MRRKIACVLALVVCLQTSCAVPIRPEHLAQPDKKSLGRVAIVAAHFAPDYQFEPLITGKGNAAARGAFTGALSCSEIFRGSSGTTGSTAGAVLLVFLACLPVSAAIGALVGTWHGASAQQVTDAKSAAQSGIAALDLQNAVAEAALHYCQDMDLDVNRLQQVMGPTKPEDLPDYTEAQDQTDTIIEISVLHAKAFTSGEQELEVSFGMQARVRVLDARDGREIDTLLVESTSYARPLEEWLEADGQAVRTAFDSCSAWIAEQAVDEILLIYHPETASQPAPAEMEQSHTERVPPYALRAIEPPVRNKIYWSRMTYGHLERYPVSGLQPAFRWEAWPRGFDIVPGNAADQADQVRYDFRVFAEKGIVYERRGIVDNEHRLEKPLEPCQTYRWTVRARFTLNDAPRTTEWMGAYDTMGGSVAPWWWRRGSGAPVLALVPDSVVPFFPIVETGSMDGKGCPDR